MLVKITPRRIAIINYVNKYVTENGYSPTIREIGAAVKIPSTSVVSFNLSRLEQAGLIARRVGKIRETKIINTPSSNHVEANYLIDYVGNRRRVKRLKPETLKAIEGCAYCGDRCAALQTDHFYPLSMGGADETYNLIPACAKCNMSKAGKEPVAWVLDNFGVGILKTIIARMLRAA